ncbi:hypothetical protein, partial [Escherichia coli]|uniref:hypothetical protein n=1 Tax=Escherichia coli TaxID=562 RepID=UPI001BC842D7
MWPLSFTYDLLNSLTHSLSGNPCCQFLCRIDSRATDWMRAHVYRSQLHNATAPCISWIAGFHAVLTASVSQFPSPNLDTRE